MPNLNVTLGLERNFAVSPFGTYQTNVIGLPAPIWDQNKGNIIAAQGRWSARARNRTGSRSR